MAVTWKKLAYEDDVITKAVLTEQGDIIYASGVGTPAALAHGTSGEVLTTGGHGANPAWAAAAAHALDAGQSDVTITTPADDEVLSYETDTWINKALSALSGTLPDDQHVLDAEVTAVIEATPLNDLAAADGAVNCGGQQMTDMVLQNSAEPPATAVLGKIYFDTDLSPYVCTAIV